MLLKLLRAPHGQNELVCQGASKTYAVKVGDTLDVEEGEAKVVLSKWAGFFAFEHASAQVQEAQPEQVKIVSKYRNKSVTTEG